MDFIALHIDGSNVCLRPDFVTQIPDRRCKSDADQDGVDPAFQRIVGTAHYMVGESRQTLVEFVLVYHLHLEQAVLPSLFQPSFQ